MKTTINPKYKKIDNFVKSEYYQKYAKKADADLDNRVIHLIFQAQLHFFLLLFRLEVLSR
jgi:hypothetical protein